MYAAKFEFTQKTTLNSSRDYPSSDPFPNRFYPSTPVWRKEKKNIIGTRGCRPEKEEGLAITGCQAYWQSISARKDRRAKQLVACRQ
ncbi:hypothetical protein TNIN_341771 [Trichonephila inaurata madagascariensis]|uniref:Uncharacterized protein n=1 Tax=Trichonephila inaurata madagascariensis TaxID=2747483 RepID=A0A8X7C0B6_9ARAC|nr:hypothetical protein TNIN_341771 [Trichonephila inaurata madagascariensis]